MLQIIDLENNELFSEISHQESATVIGGLAASYIFGAAAATAGIFGALIAFGVYSIMSEIRKSINENVPPV
ncbi:MAG: hypothetical protein KAF91_16640 [Nostoc sp. TH1S01]|nr:hypothetical protein [Nostoc sp. TH1S01]